MTTLGETLKPSSHPNTVSDDVESELLTPAIRALHTRALLAYDLAGILRTPPFLFRDRNGKGASFTRFRYSPADGTRQSLCLSGLKTNDEKLLRNRINGRWPVTLRELHRTIKTLRARRRQAREIAHALAGRCGFRFHGWLLRSPHRSRK